ncbi:DUF5615 family PIN-like protein [Leptolyngbya sp. KIOST-1]|uniref:DUF5615 family PIN-like protein n=1 Tax=Leptolyngbya sp. KIOST-1 TaxID=1229172 RepID=UPI0021F1FD54|nr:DUF5615 family PIN-like protein [Leptolyngbya sp. KIOST-1]
MDENTGVFVSRWLRSLGHEVFSVYEEARGIDDDKIIKKAFDENWILITSDKDFGEKVYRERYPHRGIIFLRLENERSANKVAVLQRFLENYSDRASDNFVVVTERQVRFAKMLL